MADEPKTNDSVTIPELPEGYEIAETDGKKVLRRKLAQNQPPSTPAIVDDKHSKRIRELESKLASGETNQTTLKKELEELREIVRKAAQTTLPVTPTKPKQTVLGYIEDLLWPPSNGSGNPL